ncbi:ribokinase [Acidipila sp. EB88]|uniref:ribokinase n=1 Tax=Acidipila sp. EB88 TaxID=2305226 RepID=UPI000F5FA9B1|nr:ribokinase [Acidipila sp. EB88]RRA48164.1 ribokinase [Acidipila sp. EB88]
MPKQIVVVGSINLDLVASVERMPAEGETVPGESFAMHSGGKGANQAVAAARLGADVHMIGRVGDDVFAPQLLRDLTEAGAHTDCVRVAPGPSGTAVITVSAHGANSIIVISGANDQLQPSSLDEHMAVIREAAILLCQLEIPMETVEYLGTLAERFQIPLVLDPAPARALSSRVLRNVTWLTPNESECATLLEHLGHGADADMRSEAAMQAAADQLLALGVRNVILKLGARGVFLHGRDVAPVLIPPFHVHAVDSTAAGDAFNGGFAYALAHEGMAPAEAARFACAVAAVSVTRAGAQPSMPTLAEVKALL